MKQEQLRKQTRQRDREEAETTPAGGDGKLAAKTDQVVADIDDVLEDQLDDELLADIDDVLEEDAQAFVDNFVQVGGE